MVSISELREGMTNVMLKARVKEVSEPRQVFTKFGTQTSLTEAVLEDETGSIKAAFWGEQSEGLEEGAVIEISGAFVKSFRETLQLGLGRNGKISVIG